MKKYYSGFISTDWYEMPANYILKGKYFSISFDVPRYGKSKEFSEVRSLKGEEVIIEGKEVIIETANFKNAEKASELIHAALTLILGESPSRDRPGIFPLSKEESEILQVREDLHIVSMWLPDVLLACQIACKASYRRAYSYALLKYRLGASLFPVSLIDVDPYHSEYYPLSSFPPDLVQMAYAIIAFYSVIEELGLEIRASEETPSLINGQWNPPVRSDLEKRLRKSRINPEESFSWNLRSTPTRIEKHLRREKRLKEVQKSLWSRGRVRDAEINIEDAILIVSYLRSKVSSHKFCNLVRSLSIYDFSNANYLVRRILLGKLGFWEQLVKRKF